LLIATEWNALGSHSGGWPSKELAKHQAVARRIFMTKHASLNRQERALPALAVFKQRHGNLRRTGNVSSSSGIGHCRDNRPVHRIASGLAFITFPLVQSRPLICDSHCWPQWDCWLLPFFSLGSAGRLDRLLVHRWSADRPRRDVQGPNPAGFTHAAAMASLAQTVPSHRAMSSSDS